MLQCLVFRSLKTVTVTLNVPPPPTKKSFGLELTHLRKRAGGGRVNQAEVRRDIVLTWGQTKRTLTLARARVNSTESWQRSASLPCKVCAGRGRAVWTD